ncbi:hypothetical protein GCM10010518_58470 [Kitasatospora cinereorecta]
MPLTGRDGLVLTLVTNGRVIFMLTPTASVEFAQVRGCPPFSLVFGGPRNAGLPGSMPREWIRAIYSLRAVPQFLVDQRAASDAVYRKAEGRPNTGRIRAFRQRGEVP